MFRCIKYMDTKKVGRPIGAKNKLSGAAKENIAAVFTRLGGTAQMSKWAKENPTEFYKIYARLIPIEHFGDVNLHTFAVPLTQPVEEAPKWERRTVQ